MAGYTLGAFLKKRRKELGYTQYSLAEKIGAPQSYISLLENGKKQWPKKYIPALAEALDVPEYQLAIEAGVVAGWEPLSEALDDYQRYGARLIQEPRYALLNEALEAFKQSSDEEKIASFTALTQVLVGMAAGTGAQYRQEQDTLPAKLSAIMGRERKGSTSSDPT